nr:hypothetical protein [Pandoravirus massiliensis]
MSFNKHVALCSLLACAAIAFGLAISYAIAAPAVTIVSALGATSFSINIKRGAGRRVVPIVYTVEPAPGSRRPSTLHNVEGPFYEDYIDFESFCRRGATLPYYQCIDTLPYHPRACSVCRGGGHYHSYDPMLVHTLDSYTIFI